MPALKFTRTHEWIRPDGAEILVGITDHAQKLLGDMVFVDCPKAGKTVQIGEEMGVVESVKAASDFYAPVSGIVTAVNTRLVDNPELVNRSPYEEGWLVKLKPTAPQQMDELLSQDEYDLIIAEDS